MSALSVRAAIACSLAAAALEFTGCDSRQHGEQLFEQHCVECHEMPNPELKKQPPKLEGLFHSKTLPSGAPATDEQVRRTIIEGRGTMPAFDGRLSGRDVSDLVRYLHTLK